MRWKKEDYHSHHRTKMEKEGSGKDKDGPEIQYPRRKETSTGRLITSGYPSEREFPQQLETRQYEHFLYIYIIAYDLVEELHCCVQ